METEEMDCSCIDSTLRELSELEGDPRLTSSMKEQIQILQMDLGFLKMYICCWDQWNLYLGSTSKSHIEGLTLDLGKAGKCLYTAGIAALESGEFEDWNIFVCKLQERIELCKPNIKRNCHDLLDCEFEWKFSISKLHKFMECIVISLNNHLHMKADMFAGLKMQIDALKLKLNLFPQLIGFSMKRIGNDEPIKFLVIHIQSWESWAYKAACLSILCWAEDGREENISAEVNVILSDLLQKFNVCMPQLIRMYLHVLRTSRPSPSDIAQTGEVVVNFVDFLLENVAVSIKDHIQTLREGLIILIIFRMEKSRKNEKQDKLNSVTRQVDELVDDAASFICSLCTNEMKENMVVEKRTFVQDFIERIEVVKAIIMELYPPILDSSSLNYPTTNLMGFIDLLSKDLKEMLECKLVSIPFIKHQFVILQEELLSLRPFLEDVQQLQNEHGELKELWTRIASMAYRAANAINSFCYMHHCLWNEMIYLSNVMEEVKLTKSEVLKTLDQLPYNIRDANAEESPPSPVLPIPACTSNIDEVIDEVVGFEDDAKAIIDQITHGSKRLDIVSIVGMPGQGKTTLAKKVYNNPSVKYHFHKCAWVDVSQSYKRRRLLMQILEHVTGSRWDFPEMEVEYCEEELYRSLKGQRYLIILDDIWDVGAWDNLKLLFPDDKNGSRIVFTSRIYNIALQAESNCIPHHLSPMSDEVSWTLLQKKLFKDGCPPTFSEIGMQIAKDCKGLPLAIVVIAGLLARKVESLEWWKQIAESVGSFAAREGCMDILELSYWHLPEFLKPCFLYLGVFEEDEEIDVQNLIRLWISERFIKNSGMKKLENVAEEYLKDLVTRSLVIVSRRSSTDGIKFCRIHDLIRKFCLVQGERENFLQVMCGDSASNDPRGSVHDLHRLCIGTEWKSFLDSNLTGPYVHSLMLHLDEWSREYFNFRVFQSLQVLSMEDLIIKSLDDFEVITSLILLRYLAIGCGFREFPSSIVHLVNLETIYLDSASFLIHVPNNVWTLMKKLRHVKVKQQLSGRSISSQYLDHGESSRSEGLQTFSKLFIHDANKAESLFRGMPGLRKLKFILEADAEFPMLGHLTELESLRAEYDEYFVLAKAYSIEEERKFGWRVRDPFAIVFPSTLKKLTLVRLNLPWSEIQLIGNLPNLEVLKLLRDAFYGPTWKIEDEMFLKLKFLKLADINLSNWETWSDHPFPCLQHLFVLECFMLKEIPSRFGDIPTLKTIEVRGCSDGVMNSARHIQKDQVDMGNEDFKLYIYRV